MSWRFRQSFKIIPGIKLNLSKSGLSASIGGAPFTVNLGPRGLYGTASLPGSGVSFRQKLSEANVVQPGKSFSPQSTTPASFPASSPNPDQFIDPAQEIRSASTELLTSENLQDLKQIIQTAYEERDDISRQLSKSKEDETRASARYLSWEKGFFFKNIFKKSFLLRKDEAEVASAKSCELAEQLQLTTVAAQIELSKDQADPYFRLRDEFAALAECAAIWDVESQKATDKFRERTTANSRVSRERVKFSLQNCDLISWEHPVPHLQNTNGGDLFLYPGFILYRAAKTAFSVIDFHDVKVSTARVRFTEENSVPSDSKTIGQTWAKVNKDGSPDRRFANNYQIPIVLYGELTFKSESGLWECFQFSNPDRLDSFVKSWNAFAASLPRNSVIRNMNTSPGSKETIGDSAPATSANAGFRMTEEDLKRRALELKEEARKLEEQILMERNKSQQYYVLVDDKEQGPFTLDQLRSMILTSEITSETLFAQPGMSEWLPVGGLLGGAESYLDKNDQPYSGDLSSLLVASEVLGSNWSLKIDYLMEDVTSPSSALMQDNTSKFSACETAEILEQKYRQTLSEGLRDLLMSPMKEATETAKNCKKYGQSKTALVSYTWTAGNTVCEFYLSAFVYETIPLCEKDFCRVEILPNIPEKTETKFPISNLGEQAFEILGSTKPDDVILIFRRRNIFYLIIPKDKRRIGNSCNLQALAKALDALSKTLR